MEKVFFFFFFAFPLKSETRKVIRFDFSEVKLIMRFLFVLFCDCWQAQEVPPLTLSTTWSSKPGLSSYTRERPDWVLTKHSVSACVRACVCWGWRWGWPAEEAPTGNTVGLLSPMTDISRENVWQKAWNLYWLIINKKEQQQNPPRITNGKFFYSHFIQNGAVHV